MRPIFKKIVIALALGLPTAGLGALWIIHDRVGAATDEAVARWSEDARRAGIGVTLPEPADGGGFPFTSRRVFTAPALWAPDWRAEAASLVVEISLLDPKKVVLRLVGPASYAANGASAPIALRGEARITTDLRSRTLVGGGTLPLAATAVFEDVTIPDADGRPWTVENLTLNGVVVEPPPADHTAPGYTLSAAARGIEPPPGLGLPGDGRATAHFTVKGEPPTPNPFDLERWRVDGGTVELDRLEVLGGGARLTGDGTLALDRGLQPEGAVTLRGEGVVAMLDRLGEAGAIPLPPRDFQRIRSAAAMLTQPDPAGGAPRMTIPLFIQNGRVFAGPMMVAKFPPLRW